MTNEAVALEQLTKFENENKIRIPQDYKKFVADGAIGAYKCKSLDFVGIDDEENSTGFRNLLAVDESSGESVQNKYRYMTAGERIPKRVVPIAEDIGGNMVCMDVGPDRNGAIYFWDHEFELDDDLEENLALIAPNFSAFLALLYDDED